MALSAISARRLASGARSSGSNRCEIGAAGDGGRAVPAAPDQVRIEADHRVAAADGAALDRFEQEGRPACRARSLRNAATGVSRSATRVSATRLGCSGLVASPRRPRNRAPRPCLSTRRRCARRRAVGSTFTPGVLLDLADVLGQHVVGERGLEVLRDRLVARAVGHEGRHRRGRDLEHRPRIARRRSAGLAHRRREDQVDVVGRQHVLGLVARQVLRLLQVDADLLAGRLEGLALVDLLHQFAPLGLEALGDLARRSSRPSRRPCTSSSGLSWAASMPVTSYQT